MSCTSSWPDSWWYRRRWCSFVPFRVPAIPSPRLRPVLRRRPSRHPPRTGRALLHRSRHRPHYAYVSGKPPREVGRRAWAHPVQLLRLSPLGRHLRRSPHLVHAVSGPGPPLRPQLDPGRGGFDPPGKVPSRLWGSGGGRGISLSLPVIHVHPGVGGGADQHRDLLPFGALRQRVFPSPRRRGRLVVGADRRHQGLPGALCPAASRPPALEVAGRRGDRGGGSPCGERSRARARSARPLLPPDATVRPVHHRASDQPIPCRRPPAMDRAPQSRGSDPGGHPPPGGLDLADLYPWLAGGDRPPATPGAQGLLPLAPALGLLPDGAVGVHRVPVHLDPPSRRPGCSVHRGRRLSPGPDEQPGGATGLALVGGVGGLLSLYLYNRMPTGFWHNPLAPILAALPLAGTWVLYALVATLHVRERAATT